ncbi:unnamed protein product [Polarella glacialis]|uniref:Uncharacterized protein n=1 Tax=Polarella glacialis TaxID=89957 RepID=A0A813G556_POLGL|nr:unnamed protein product [Polarella glacialis]
MTMELLEGRAELSKDSPAAREGNVPPMRFGLRQQMNFAREILPGTHFRILIAWISMLLDRVLGTKPPSDVTLVHDAKTLFRYYESPHADDLGEFIVFRPAVQPQESEKLFRKFLRIVDIWSRARKLVGYYFLMSFSPYVAPCVTTDINDMCDVKARYRAAFARPGPVPPPPAFVICNPQWARLLLINNYGVHTHDFKAKPVAFV